MFDLRQIRTFRAVAAARSFTRAAVALNYAQSSVTAQVRGLEDSLGVPLFDRLGRRVELTTAGRQFLHYADKLLALAEEAKLSVHGDGEPAGPLTVSASESLLTYRLPKLLRTFQRRYPAVQLSLRTSTHSTAAAPVDSGVDIALTIDEPIESEDVIVRRLRPEPMVAAVCAGHALAKRKQIGASDLVDHQILLTDPSCSYRTLFERTLLAEGARVSKFQEFASVEAIKQCALAGMGVGILPQVVVKAELNRGSLVALRWPNERMCVYTQLVRHKAKWNSPVMQAFWDLAVSLVASKEARD